jgi:hypothetical protein
MIQDLRLGLPFCISQARNSIYNIICRGIYIVFQNQMIHMVVFHIQQWYLKKWYMDSPGNEDWDYLSAFPKPETRFITLYAVVFISCTI